MDIKLENYHTGNMDLYDTIGYMNSADYKERFIAEYCQLKIRTRKLSNMIQRYQNNELDDTLESNIDTLIKQFNAMIRYLEVLELRALEERIKLPLG